MSRIYKKLPKDVRRETEFQIEPFWNKYDGLLYYVNTKGFLVPLTQGDGSIYVSDGTLTGDRTLTGGGNFLHFVDLSNFTVDTINNINLNPGSTVDIEDTKYITIGNPTGRQIAVQSRDNTCKIEWISLAPSNPGTRGQLVAERGWKIDPGVYAGLGQATIIANGLANYAGTGNDIADINVTAYPKTLVTKEWVEQYGPAGSGTNDYIPRWTPDGNTLGDSIIQDDGTTLGIGTAPSATIHAKMVTSSLAKSIEVTNTTDTASVSTGVDVINKGTLGTKIGIKAAGSPVNTDNISVGGVFIGGGGSYTTSASTQYGIIVDVGANIGFTHDSYAAYITADTSNAGDNIGIYINTANAGAGNHYIGKLIDGNEGAGQVLTSDAAGHASWQTAAGVLTNIYTADGTLGGARVVTMATNTINFNGGKVGVGVVPAGSDDFQVSGGALLDALNINSAYFFPTTVAPANDGDPLLYNAASGGLVFGTLDISNGGTGEITAQLAINALSAVSAAAVGEVLTKVGGDAQFAAIPDAKRTWNWGAARNNINVTNQYIRTFNGTLTNLSPYVVPFDCILTDLTCSTRGNETWVAEVREDPRPGGTETVIASISVTAANQDSNIGLSVALSAGDEIGFYCNGTGISYPHIQAWFKET